MLKGNHVAIAGCRHKNVSFLHGLLHRGHLEPLHSGLQSTNRIDLRNQHARTIRAHRLCTPLAHIAVTKHHHHLAGNHHIRCTLDAIGQRLATSVQVIELRFGNRIVHINGRHQQFASFHHLIQPVNARRRFFRNPLQALHRLVPAAIILVQDPLQRIQDGLFFTIRPLSVEHLRIFFGIISFVHQQRSIAPVVHNQIRPLAVGKPQRHIGTPPILLNRLAFPRKNRHSCGSNRCSGMILRRKNIAARPTHIGTQCHQRFNQHCRLYGHMQRTGNAGALQGLLCGIFSAQGHQSRHLLFGYFDFLSSEIGQRYIGNFIR